MYLHGEKEAKAEILNLGERFGYGNMINHLQSGWIVSLLEKYPEMSIEAAYLAAGRQLDKATLERLNGIGTAEFLRRAKLALSAADSGKF